MTMIAINKDEWINPENIESVFITHEGMQLFMVSGRVIQVIDSVSEIMKDIEFFFNKKMGAIPEPRLPSSSKTSAKRKYTKKKKENDEGVETL